MREDTDTSVTPGIPKTTNPDDPSNQQDKAADYAAHIVTPYGRRSLCVPAWYRGVSLIMQTMGQMLIQYQRMNRVGGNFTEDRYGEMRRLNYLLQVSPNPRMTGSQLLEQIEFRKIFYGNAYVYIERGIDGEIANLWLCSSGSFNAANDTYALTYHRRGGVASIIAPASDVLHFKNVFTTDDFTTGIPTIQFAMKSLSIAATADEQTLKDMAKGGKHKIIVQEREPSNMQWGGTLAAGKYNKKELQQATDQFGEDMMSKDVVLLTNAADTKIISQTAAELRTLENRGFQVADIARLLGVPTIMLMLDSGNNYKTPEAATQEFLLRTIQPRIAEMEDEFNRKLLGPDDFGRRRIHICEQNLRRLDPKQQADLDKVHLETGAMNVNEIRAQYDLPEVPDGDIFYVSTNLAVIGSDKLKSSGAGRPSESTSQQPPEDGNGGRGPAGGGAATANNGEEGEE